ncbi:hypothetical protein L1D51_12280 [Pseudoalteromonas shioyasakiensis]|uniref:hypothetical protein n=1 Tax=Pseudoalteromonas shioyasakiensis TaxID=1190813 RepID=UPI001EFDE7E0|nr:hypothetical protein [Pseudoalteromonas shioyasakiensis]MCG9734771.1 hypothetical protein [Pseudoalteromonas shioyasakiensis]
MKFIRVANSIIFIPEFNVVEPMSARIGFVMWNDDGRTEIELANSWGEGGYAFWPPLYHDSHNWGRFGNNILDAFKAQNNVLLEGREVRFGFFSERGFTANDDWIEVQSNPTAGSSDTVAKSVELKVGNESFKLNIQNNAPITLTQDGFLFGTAIVPHSLRVKREDGGSPAGIPWPVVGDLLLSLANSETAGCFEFISTLDQNSLDNLGVQLRFSVAGEYDEFWNSAPINSSRFTLFTYDGPFANRHKLKVRIDLQQAYNKSRTFMTFVGAGAYGTSSESLAIQSYFETADGHRVGMIPLEDSRLVLERFVDEYIDGELPNQRAQNYLTPDGQFELLVHGDDGSSLWPERHKLLTGLSRTEYLEFTPRRADNLPGNVIRFTSQQAAADFRTIPDGLGINEDLTGDLLSNQLTTSWIDLPSNIGPELVASRQPERMALHGRKVEKGLDEDVGLLSFEPNYVEHNTPIPIVPLLGLSNTQDLSDTAIDLEKTVLSSQRSKLLRKQVTGLGSDSVDKTLYTPQGFRIKLREDGTWSELLIAHIPIEKNLHSNISLENINGDFVDLLMHNRVFMVTSSSQDITGTKMFNLKGTFNVAGWGFSADLGNNASVSANSSTSSLSMPTALIVKSHDKSIADLVKDPQLWTNRNQLGSESLLNLQAALINYIKAAREHAVKEKVTNPGVKSRYGSFLNAIDNPDWNGFLLVNVNIDTSNLPLQIKGLMGGVNKKLLAAHHFGIELTRNEKGVKGLTPKKSSIFGLVDYPALGSEPAPQPKDPYPNQPSLNDSRYDFKLQKMSVLFENAEVTRFDCRIALFIGALFTDSVKSEQNKAEHTGRILSFDGQYEGRFVDGIRRDTYTFIHKKSYEFKLDTFIFEKLIINKLQFITESSTPIGQGREKIKTRVALWGNMNFQEVSEDINFPGIEKLDFYDLGITFQFQLGKRIELPDLIPNFDIGPVRFELPEKGFGSGFLPSLPFKLKFFQTAPRNDPISLGEEGYFGMSFGDSSPKIPKFRFGLGFDADLGAFGSLASSLKGIRMTLLFGWIPKVENEGERSFSVGLRFEGGGGRNLDIGLQGIMRLTAEDYDFGKVETDNGKSYFMVSIKKAHLNLLGKKLPKDDGFTLFLFVDPENPDVDKIGWFMGLDNLSSPDGFDVKYLGLGQRVNAYNKPGVPSTVEVVEHLKTHGAIREVKHLKQKLAARQVVYDADRGWTIGLQTLIYDAFDLDIVFMDPEMYGARLRVPSSNSPAPLLFDVDILYRKITDDLGVYSTEIVLPDHIRQIEFGAASVTVPAICLDIWTDGGVTVDLGYPSENLDFSRSFTVQMLPFLGSGGMIYSRISGLGATTFPQPIDSNWRYSPVMRVAFAARVGLGKEIRKGILRAGLSLSVFGMIDGVWGKLRYVGSQKPVPATQAPKSYVIVSGRYGLVGEIFGYVDFRIVRAGVSIRVWSSVGVVLETWNPTTLYFEAGVSVRVRVVIARIKVFGKRIEIKASFSFRSTIRYDWKIGSRDSRYESVFGAGLGLEEVRPVFGSNYLTAPPISWDYSFKVWQKKEDLTVWFTPDVSLNDDGVPQVVLLMICEGGPEAKGIIGERPFDKVIWSLLVWAIREKFKDLGEFRGSVLDWELSIEHVDNLEQALAQPIALSSHGSEANIALDYNTLRKFLKENFNLTIREHPEGGAGESKGGAQFPVPSELILQIEDNGIPYEVKLSDLRKVSENYQTELDEYFEKMLVLMDERKIDTGLGSDSERLAIEILFEDYFALLIKTAVEEVKQAHLTFSESHIAVSRLLQKMTLNPETDPNKPKQDAFSRIAASAGRYQFYGLRVKKPDDPQDTMAFFDLAQLQIPLRTTVKEWSSAFANQLDYRLSLSAAPEAWFSVNAAESKLDIDALEAMRLVDIHPDWVDAKVLNILRGQNRRYGFSDPVRISSEQNYNGALYGTLWPITEMLRADLHNRLGENGKGSLPLTLKVGNANNNEDEDKHINHWQWTSKIQLHITRVERVDGDSQFVPNTYMIGGVSEANRYVLDRLLTDKDSRWYEQPDKLDVFLLHEDLQSEGALKHLPLNRSDSFAFKTNLSRISRPHGFVEDGFGYDEEIEDNFAANFTAAEKLKLLEIIRQGSVVNSGGYFLHIETKDGSGLPSAIFDSNNDRTYLTLMIVFKGENLPAREYFTNLYIPNEITDSAITDASDSASKSFLYAESEDKVYEPVIEPGHIPLNVVRAAPFRRYIKSDGTRGTLAQAVADVDVDMLSETERVAALFAAGNIEVELEERFNLLEWEIKGDADFVAQSGDSVLPIGPADFEESDEIPETFNREDWLYEQLVPAYKFAQQNVGLSPEERNLYACVGKTMTFRIGFRDIYGNRLNRSPSRPINIRLEYFDHLLNPLKLPAVASSYAWGRSGSLEIMLCASFDPNTFAREMADGTLVFFDPGVENDPENDALGERLIESQRLYRRMQQQLADPNITAGIETSLSTDCISLCRDKINKLRKFCVEGYAVIESLLQGDSPVNRPSWSQTVKVLKMPEEDFVEIKVALCIARSQSNVIRMPDATEKPYLPAWKNTTAIAPKTAAALKEGSEKLLNYAIAFKTAFEGFELTTGVGRQGTQSFWAVSSKVIQLQIDWQVVSEGPAIFAPPPLSTSLLSAEFEYDEPLNTATMSKLKASIRDADIDDYMRLFLRDIARFLSPEIAVPARKISGSVLDEVLRYKRELAGKLAAKITTVLIDERPFINEASLPAKSVFKDRLITDLPSAYDVDSVLSYPLKINSAFKDQDAPSVYGRIVLASEDITSLPIMFRPVKVQLDSNSPWLVALFDSKREKRRAEEKLNPNFLITHVEQTFDSKDYRPSAWLKLIEEKEIPLTPPASGQQKPVSIPVPLRRFPVTPTLMAQSFTPQKIKESDSLIDWFEQARGWHFKTDYGRPDVDQDTVYFDVRYNNQYIVIPQGGAATENEPKNWVSLLFKSLVIYRTHRDEIWTSLNKLPTGQFSQQIQNAVTAFANLAKAVTESFQQDLGLEEGGMLGLVDKFKIDEDPIENGSKRRIDLIWKTPTQERRAKELSIVPLSNTSQLIPTESPVYTADSVQVIYQRRPDHLQFGEGEWIRRRVGLNGLDILSTENAWSGLELKRNEDLIDGRTTNPKFVYSTSAVRFGQHLTPTLKRFESIDISDGIDRTLQEHLIQMFNSMLNVAKAPSDMRNMARCDIGWGYDNELLAELVPEVDSNTLITRTPIPSQRLVARNINLLGTVAGSEETIESVAASVQIAAQNTVLNKVYPTIESGTDKGKPRGALVFDVTIYAHIEEENKPTLQLFNLTLPLARILRRT